MRNLNFLKGTSTILAAGIGLGSLVPLTLPLALGCSTQAKDKADVAKPSISGFYLSNNALTTKTDTTTALTITKGDTVYARGTFATTNGTGVITPTNTVITTNVPKSLGVVNEDRTFTLTVTNAEGETATATATVHAVDAPNAAITTAPSAVRDTAGLSASVPSVPGSIYEWSITNGVITDGNGTNAITFTSGSAGAQGAAGTMTLTCKVTSAAKVTTSSTSTLSVVALPPASLVYAKTVLSSFVNVPFALGAPTSGGDPVQSYSISPDLPLGLTLDPATGAISGRASVAAEQKVYRVTASNSGGSTFADLTLTVAPQTNANFSASPDAIGPNGGAVLSWTVSDAISGFTIDQGVQPTLFDTSTVRTGTFNVHPAATTTYTMTAYLTAGGTVEIPATVTLDSTPLAISNFKPEKASTTFGASDKFTWTLAGTPNTMDVNGTSVLGTNSITLVPERRQTFTLTAVNGASNATSSVTVPAMGLDVVAGSIAGAGTADSTNPTIAQFNGPRQLAVDTAGNFYVADASSHTIRMISTTGAVTTISGIPGISGNVNGDLGNAKLSSPRAIAVTADGTSIYVQDCGNKSLRLITKVGGVWNTSTVAGVTFGNSGYGQMTLDPSGAFLLMVDYSSNNVRILRLSDGASGIYAGPASGYGHTDVTSASLAGVLFDNPEGIAFNKAGTYFYVTDAYKDITYIRAVSWTAPAATGAITPPTGTTYSIASAGVKGYKDGTGAEAYFNGPAALCVDSNDVLWVADSTNSVIRTITVPTMGNMTGVVTTAAGVPPTGTVTAPVAVTGNIDGPVATARFNNPQGLVAYKPAGASVSNIYVTEVNNSTVRCISNGIVTTPYGSAMLTGSTDAVGTAARFNAPTGIACAGGYAYVADAGNNSLRKVKISDGTTTTLANTFTGIKGVAIDKNGVLYVADATAHTIYQVAADGTLTTILSAGLTAPTNLAVSPLNPNLLYVVDGNAVQEVTVTRNGDVFSTAAITNTIGAQGNTGYVDGAPGTARFKTGTTGYWAGIAVDANGKVFLADYGNDSIRKIDPTAATPYSVTTYAGIPTTATYGFVDSATLTAAKFNYPTGLLIDSTGDIYVADRNNHAIRKIGADGVTTLVGLATAGSPVRIGAIPGSIGTGGSAGLYMPLGIAMDGNGDIFAVTNNGIMQATDIKLAK